MNRRLILPLAAASLVLGLGASVARADPVKPNLQIGNIEFAVTTYSDSYYGVKVRALVHNVGIATGKTFEARATISVNGAPAQVKTTNVAGLGANEWKVV